MGNGYTADLVLSPAWPQASGSGSRSLPATALKVFTGVPCMCPSRFKPLPILCPCSPRRDPVPALWLLSGHCPVLPHPSASWLRGCRPPRSSSGLDHPNFLGTILSPYFGGNHSSLGPMDISFKSHWRSRGNAFPTSAPSVGFLQGLSTQSFPPLQ